MTTKKQQLLQHADLFKKLCFIDCAIIVVPTFSPLPLHPAALTPLFMSMGHV